MKNESDYKISIEKRLARVEVINWLTFIMISVLTGVKFL